MMRTKKFDLNEYLSGEKAVFQNKVIEPSFIDGGITTLRYQNFEWREDGTPKNFTPKEWDGKLKLLKA